MVLFPLDPIQFRCRLDVQVSTCCSFPYAHGVFPCVLNSLSIPLHSKTLRRVPNWRRLLEWQKTMASHLDLLQFRPRSSDLE